MLGFQAINLFQVWQSTKLPDVVDFEIWRVDGAGPNGTYELTDAELATLAPEIAQAFAQANATGYGNARIREIEMAAFRLTVHESEHHHDALQQGYPLGNYVKWRGIFYRH